MEGKIINISPINVKKNMPESEKDDQNCDKYDLKHPSIFISTKQNVNIS